MKRLLIGSALLAALAGTVVVTTSLIRSGAGAQGGYFGSTGNQTSGGYYGAYNMRPLNPMFNTSGNLVWYPSVSSSLSWTDPYFTETPGRFAVSRTSDSIDVVRDKEGQLQLKWQGEPRAVKSMTVTFLDKDRKKLLEQSVSKLPVNARVKPPEKSAYYRFIIEYVDGSTTSVTSPFEAPPAPMKTGPTSVPIKS